MRQCIRKLENYLSTQKIPGFNKISRINSWNRKRNRYF